MRTFRMVFGGAGRPQHPEETLTAPESAQSQTQQTPGTTVMAGSTASFQNTKSPGF